MGRVVRKTTLVGSNYLLALKGCVTWGDGCNTSLPPTSARRSPSPFALTSISLPGISARSLSDSPSPEDLWSADVVPPRCFGLTELERPYRLPSLTEYTRPRHRPSHQLIIRVYGRRRPRAPTGRSTLHDESFDHAHPQHRATDSCRRSSQR